MGRKTKATSKAYKVTLTTIAKQHKELEEFIANVQNQTLNALKIGDAMDKVFDRIAANPFAFRICEEISSTDKSYRKATCLSWNIIFKITGFEVDILGIVTNRNEYLRLSDLERGKIDNHTKNLRSNSFN